MPKFLEFRLLKWIPFVLSLAALVSCSKERPLLSVNVPKNVNAEKHGEIPNTTVSLPNCFGSEIHTIVRPVFPNKANSESPVFTYSFRLRKAKVENAPTIIYLPGGPGQPSIGDKAKPWMDEFNYVFTDVRGSGCNEFPPEVLPDDSIRTEYAASDVLAIIDYLNDPQRSKINLGNYLIYGVSYGTVLATVVGSQIENSVLPQPQGIVLEGILGKLREHGDGQPIETLLQYLRELTPFILSHVKTEFRSNKDPFGIGMSADQWVKAIWKTMSVGSVLTQYDEKDNKMKWEHFLPYLLNRLPSNEQIQFLRAWSLINVGDFISRRAYLNIACHELFKGGLKNASIKRAEIKVVDEDFKIESESVEGPDVCEGKVLDHPYNSALYQLKTPLYYFQGSLDPQTLYEEAKYHYDHQQHASKHFVTFKYGGHTPLMNELSLFQGGIFKQIIEAPQNFETFIANLVGAGAPLIIGF